MVVIGIVVLVGVLGLATLDHHSTSASNTPGHLHSTDAPRTTLGSQDTAPPSTTPVPLRGIAVAMTQSTFVDTTRAVTSNGAVLASTRSLPTYLWTPTTPGPFPVVVFVHGYNIGPLQYQRFCSTLASSGYVVAAPSFPLEDPSRGFGLNRSDIPAEATDVSFVITSLLADPAIHKIDPGRVAVVGHSDGADVVLLVGYGTDHVDLRVHAVVADAPDPMTGGVQPSPTPLLLVQGTADSVVPYSASQDVFSQVDSPVYYLSLIGADHLPPIAGGTEWTPALDASVAAFLDAEVAGRGGGPGSLPTGLAASALVRLASKA
jgi:dienelactone hydrolase